jgi:restriction endonuclease Mrr
MIHENEVATAFDIVLEEIENAIEGLNQDGAKAFQKGNYDRARELMEKGSQMTAFRERVNDLQKEWGNIFATITPRKRRRKRSRKATERLERGLRTREDAFRVPILQALVQLGGSAPVTEVMNKVSDLMKNQLNEYDRSSLPSTPASPRWRNTAQWARNAMVREGLLASDSPRGTWEITEEGERWLATQTTRG